MTPTEKSTSGSNRFTIGKPRVCPTTRSAKKQSLIYHQFIYWRQKLASVEAYPKQAPAATGFARVVSTTPPRMGVETGDAAGLAVLVEQELGRNPFTGALYTFTNRQRNKIKCLMCEDNGFVLYYKALAEEKFKWPKTSDELMALTGEQINWLLDGYDIALLKGHKTLHYQAVI
jgi:hypothetical protein